MRLLCLTDNFRFGGLETRIDGYIGRADWHRILAQSVGPARDDIEPTRFFAVLPRGFRQVTAALRTRISELAPSHVEIHPFAAMTTGFAAAGLCGLPISLHFHGPASVRLRGPAWQQALFGALLEACRPTVVATSEETAELFRKRFGSGHRLSIVRNGVCASLRRTGPGSGDARPPRRLALVSRLDPDKVPGGLALLRLIAREPALGLDIIGDGDGRERLAREVRRLGLSGRVRLLGFHADPAVQLAPGQAIAGCGRALLEGLATGRRGLIVSAERVVAPVTAASFAQARRTNWSGRGLAPVPHRTVMAFLRAPPAPVFNVATFVPRRMGETMLAAIEATVARHLAKPPEVDIAEIVERHCRMGERAAPTLATAPRKPASPRLS